MKKFAFVLSSIACLTLINAGAAIVAYEPFDYTAGDQVFNQLNANGQNWLRAGVANPPNAITVGSGNLAVPPELAPAIGNSAQITGVGNGSGSSLRLGLGGSINSDTVYFSFALQITALTGANNTSGGFFIGLNNSTGTQTGNPSVVGAKVSARIDPADATKYDLGIFNNVSPTGPATTWTSGMTVGDTIFVVAGYTFNPSTGDDVSSIWINPGSLGAGSAPAPNMTATGGTDLAQVASILLRQSPAPYLNLDELRVGTDWASVTAVPEPAAVGLMGLGMLMFIGWYRSRRR